MTLNTDRSAPPKPLMISMGFNGYQWAYRRNIETQRAYAQRQGYDYVFVERPAFSPLLMECAWLKIPLLIAALTAGRPWALFLDSDIEAKESTPAVETVFEEGKTLYLANGFSGRPNSGVILVRQDPAVISVLQTMLGHALMTLPAEDDVGWGENGHVIHFAKNFPGLKILPQVWNNNQDPDLDDYFRHYSAGPMRKFYRFTRGEEMSKRLGKAYLKGMKLLRGGQNDSSGFFTRLDALLRQVRRHYPVFPDVEIAEARRG